MYNTSRCLDLCENSSVRNCPDGVYKRPMASERVSDVLDAFIAVRNGRGHIVSVRAVLSVFMVNARTAERPSIAVGDGHWWGYKILSHPTPADGCVFSYDPHGKHDVLTSAHAPISAGEFEFQTVEHSGGCRTYVQKVTISVDFMSVC